MKLIIYTLHFIVAATCHHIASIDFCLHSFESWGTCRLYYYQVTPPLSHWRDVKCSPLSFWNDTLVIYRLSLLPQPSSLQDVWIPFTNINSLLTLKPLRFLSRLFSLAVIWFVSDLLDHKFIHWFTARKALVVGEYPAIWPGSGIE